MNAAERGRAAITAAVENEDIDQGLWSFANGIISRWPDDTVYIDVSPIDDGDLSFYIRAVDNQIYLDLYSTTDGDPDGPEEDWFLSYRLGDWEGRMTGPRRAFPYMLFDYVVEQFTAYVNEANPKWRDLYV